MMMIIILYQPTNYPLLQIYQLPFINFTPALFNPNNQTNFQSSIGWSTDEVGNKISEKSISSLTLKYEIPNSVELRKA